MSDRDRPAHADDPRQRLVVAAIDQIEKHGIGQATVRRIAAAAEVNIAAVNYYFRSKEALLAAALEGSIRHMLEDTEEFLARMPDDPMDALSGLLGYLLEGCLRYPNLSRAHLHDAFHADDYSGPFPRLFAPVVARLRDLVRAAVPGLEERAAARRVVAALSAVFFPAFFAGLYEGLSALGSPADRLTYARELARQTLAPAETEAPAARGKRPKRG
ncbi:MULTISPECIES: TetR/AcrR family transcriptional regulator [Sorangium]|uniref:AcrR family transcriptional regulator n=1 Tax=Sorangium cellulosum TaxID=56 RepID=A0A4P2QZG2_SORCE|nr:MULTISPECIES: TetR/AcrR family transcriptional regulator [Sorangium]AUX35997.1 AcrR family transcriptional regulator [Sorangium cellulosum]WCQ95298.1 HTH-type transcriptional regulator BetI [Sorangium sp. Soce836]